MENNFAICQQEGGSSLIKMAAIGRRFQIGNLYDYRTDTIVSESLWNADKVEKLIECRVVMEINHSIFNFEILSDKKSSQFGLNSRLIMSWMSGLIGPFRLGASAYIENYWLSSSLHSCLHIRTLHRHEKLDHNLAKDKLEIVCGPAIVEHGKASHVVTAISYGLETYCVFEFNQDEQRKEEKLLQRAAHQFRNGLFDLYQQTDPPFYENVNVCLFADWNNSEEPLRLPYNEAFQRCKEQFSKSSEESLSIPLTVWLCPVENVTPLILSEEYRSMSDPDCNVSFILCECYYTFTGLIGIQLRTRSLIQHPSVWDSNALKLFDSLLIEFLNLFKNRMADLVQNYRTGIKDGYESNLKKMKSIVESSIFHPHQLLRRSIESQELWVHLADYMKETLPDVPICRNVQKADIGDYREFILILQIPFLCSAFDSLLDQMNDYISNNANLVDCSTSCPEYLKSFTSLDTIRRKVFYSVGRFANFISVNKSSKAKYFIVVDGLADPHFRLYRNESMEDYELPSPPANLRITENRRGILTLAWDMDDFVNVIDFLIEFRLFRDDDLSWTRIKSGVVGQIQLSLTDGEQYVFRIATETLAGRSEFSDQLGPESISSECDLKASEVVHLEELSPDVFHQVNEKELLDVCRNMTANLKEMEALIKRVVDVNCQDSDGRTPLLLIANFLQDGFSVLPDDTEEKNFRMAESHLAFRTIKLLSGKDNFNVNCKDNDGLNALHLLCSSCNERNQLDIVRFLVDIGIDVNCKKSDGSNALLCLICCYQNENMIDIVRLLVDKGIDVNCKDDCGLNALFYSINSHPKKNWKDIFRLLIDYGIDVNCRDEKGRNVLFRLFWSRQNEDLIDIVRLLIDKGININCKDPDGRNSLHPLFCHYKNENMIDIVRLLIHQGIDVNVADGYEDGPSALVGFWRYNRKKNMIDIFQLLFDQGMDLEWMELWNALLVLYCYNRSDDLIDIIRLLINKGIDVNCTNTGRWENSFYQNESEGLPSCQTYENFNGKDKWNVLLFLCRFYENENLIDIIRLLIDKGIDVNIKDSIDGWNALLYLCRFYKNENLIDIIRLLIDKGIDVNWKHQEGWNALNFLCRYYKKENCVDIVQLLVDEGIDVKFQEGDI